ncbi:root hair defective 3 GTP-binding protein-domain-containing protein [Russula emetica]|nr:root hair defective 3 GTP-binding protein-domain-containing protein [Russula emetica]
MACADFPKSTKKGEGALENGWEDVREDHFFATLISPVTPPASPHLDHHPYFSHPSNPCPPVGSTDSDFGAYHTGAAQYDGSSGKCRAMPKHKGQRTSFDVHIDHAIAIPLKEEQQRDVFAGDHQRLTADPTIYTPSSDGRLFGFLPYRTGIAPTFRHDAIIIGPRPHPQTPSQATAVQQHQQQLAQQQQSTRDATDNWDTDLNAAAVEEAALGTECTTNADTFQRQFAHTYHHCFNHASGFSPVVPHADSVTAASSQEPVSPDLVICPSRCNALRHALLQGIGADRTRTYGGWAASPLQTATNGQTSPVPPSLNGSEESHSSSTPGDNVLRTYKDTLANSEHSYLSKARSFDCTDEENDEAIATLWQRAWAALRTKVDEQTADTAILTKLRTYFEERFCYDEHGVPPVWKPVDDIDGTFKKTRLCYTVC